VECVVIRSMVDSFFVRCGKSTHDAKDGVF